MSALVDALKGAGIIDIYNSRTFCPVCDPDKQKGKSVKLSNNYFTCYRCGTKGYSKDALSMFGVSQKQNNSSYFARVNACKDISKVYAKSQYRNLAINYLVDRGYPTQALNLNSLEFGFAPNQPNFLESESINKSTIAEAGLRNAYGKNLYQNRLVFPIRDSSNNIIYFQGRSIDPENDVRWLASTSEPEQGLAPLPKCIYNAHLLQTYIDAGHKYLFLCEGLTDAFALQCLGLPVIATFGIQALNFSKYKSKLKGFTIIACYDNDIYPMGQPYEGLYKSWHYTIPSLASLASEEFGIKVFTLSAPNRSGIKDMFDLCNYLNFNIQDFKLYVKSNIKPLIAKALEVYSSEDSLANLINVFKYVSYSDTQYQILLDRIEKCGGWLKALS